MESTEQKDVSTAGEMALEILTNIIKELGPHNGVNFLFDMATTLLANVQANIVTDGFTKLANLDEKEDIENFLKEQMSYKFHDIIDSAKYEFKSEEDKAQWEKLQKIKEDNKKEIEEQKRLQALLNSPVTPMKEGQEIPAAQFDDSGMEKLDPEVISILSKAKKNG